MKILNFIFSIVNVGLTPLVSWKVYTWYHPLTGLNLPELTFLQVWAIQIVIGILMYSPTQDLRQFSVYDFFSNKYKGVDEFSYIQIKVTGVLLLTWALLWLLYKLIF